MNPSVTPVSAAYAKKSSNPTEAEIRRMASVSVNAITSWAMISGSARPARLVSCVSDMPATTAPMPVVSSSPRNIQKNAWVRNACASRASGRTPTWLGVAYRLIIMVDGISFVAERRAGSGAYSRALPQVCCAARSDAPGVGGSAPAGAIPGPGRRRRV